VPRAKLQTYRVALIYTSTGFGF